MKATVLSYSYVNLLMLSIKVCRQFARLHCEFENQVNQKTVNQRKPDLLPVLPVCFLPAHILPERSVIASKYLIFVKSGKSGNISYKLPELAREAEGTRLKIWRTARYRGFESHTLRGLYHLGGPNSTLLKAIWATHFGFKVAAASTLPGRQRVRHRLCRRQIDNCWSGQRIAC